MRGTRFFTAAVLACLCAFVSPSDAQDTPLTNLVPVQTETGFVADAVRRLWRVSSPQRYHKAGVKISCPNGSAGSGGIIRVTDDKALVVVTNHHVIAGNSGFVDVILHGNKRTNARIVWSDPRADVAVLVNTNGGMDIGFPVFDGDVPVGSEVEVVAFGGPGRMVPEEDLRPFRGKVVRTDYSAPLCVDAYTVSGDSGASILYDGAICGVNWGHYGHPQIQVQGEWVAGKPMASNVTGPWLARTLTQVCMPYGCRPIIRRPSQPVILDPPANSSYQPVPDGGYPEACECDEDAIAAKVVEQYGDKLTGPPGPPGEPGRDAEVTPEQLGAIAAAIMQQLKNDPSLMGPPGEQGPAGPQGPPGTSFNLASLSDSDFEELARRIQPHLDPIYPMWIDKDGNVVDEISDGVRLGYSMPLRIDMILKKAQQNAGTEPR